MSLLLIEKWPGELIAAIETMQKASDGVSVNPMKAAKLIQAHIHPLKPDLGLDQLLGGKGISWQGLETIGRGIQTQIDEKRDRSDYAADDRLAVFIGTLLIHIQDWSSKKIGERGLTTFCAFCWRHTMEGQRFCEEHNPKINKTNYRAAYRLFLNPIVTEVLPKKSRFKIRTPKRNLLIEGIIAQRRLDSQKADLHWENVMDEYSSLHRWIEHFRPHVYALIQASRPEPTEIDVRIVLEMLDTVSPGAASKRGLDERNELHEYILSQPDQLSGLLQRAEVCLSIEAQSRTQRPHGGRRKNAGRKKSGRTEKNV